MPVKAIDTFGSGDPLHTVPPPLTAAVGLGATVTVTEPLALQPPAEAVTLYNVVAVTAVAVVGFVVVLDKKVEGDHV